VDFKAETTHVGPDAFVTLSYVLFDQDGNVAGEASKEEPLTYIHGYAQILPGLEHGIEGLAKGERRAIVIDAEDAFGEPDEKAVLEVDRADLPEGGRTLTVGDELIAEDDDDDQILMRVVELRKDTVLVDTNHPLAGQTVRFEVEVRDVRAATEEELAKAQDDLQTRTELMCCAEGEHDHDHGEHTHEHAAPGAAESAADVPLTQLRRKLAN